MPNTNYPAAALNKHKVWLMEEITGTACWCRQVARLFPNNTRSIRCCDTLKALADAVEALPVTHTLFTRLEQIGQADPFTRERWLDEVRLEFSSIGYLSNESASRAIQRLIEITDDSLGEWRKVGNLH